MQLAEGVNSEKVEEKQVVEQQKIEVKVEEKLEEKPVSVEKPRRNVYVFGITLADKEWRSKASVYYNAIYSRETSYYKEDVDVWIHYYYDKTRNLHCIYYECDVVYHGSSGIKRKGFVVGFVIEVVEGEFDPDLVAIKLADWYNAFRIATYVESERQEFVPMREDYKEHLFKKYNIRKWVVQSTT